MSRLPDPRFTTKYMVDYRGIPFHEQNKMFLPKCVSELWCKPGYQPYRQDKGAVLSINDYTFHPIEHHGGLWDRVVHTPYPGDKNFLR